MKKKVALFLIFILSMQLIFTTGQEVKGMVSNAVNVEEEMNDKFKALRYGIFTGDTESNFEFSGEKFNLEGGIRSNKKVVANCNEFKVSNTLESIENSQIEAKVKEIGEEIKVKDVVTMPDIFSEMTEQIKDNADIYYNTMMFGSESVSLDRPLIVKGDAIFNYSDFKGKGSLFAENNVIMNFSNYIMEDSNKAFVYSEAGSITINSANSNINGILYAPNGTITLNGDKINLNGRIIAKRIIINAREVNIKTSDKDFELINQKPSVDAGEDVEIDISQPLQLFGIVSDEGLVNEKLDINWKKISGPGDVKFENSNSVSTKCTFNTSGEYILELSANDGQYTESDTIKIVVKGKTISDIDLKINGELKENRKVNFDFSNTKFSEEFPIKKEQTEFEIEPMTDGISVDDVKEDMENFDALSRNVLFKKAGVYKVKIKLSTERDSSEIEKTIKIVEDKEPIANFKFIDEMSDNQYLRDKNTGNATIKLKDISYSKDNDKIGKRIWKIRYDSNDDGNFEDEEYEEINTTNEIEPSLLLDKVGKYQVYLQVEESFDNTIEKFISEDDYKKADTCKKTVKETSFEIVNQAPTSKVEIEKAKNADIVFTVGKADSEKIGQVTSEIENLEDKLAKEGINAKISTISTATMKAQDSFKWDNYVHEKFDQVCMYGRPEYEHYEQNGNDLRMIGYTEKPYKDFLFVDDKNKTQKTFTFDMSSKIDVYDGGDIWHTVDGGGFLFNTKIENKESNDNSEKTIEGYCILFEENNINLYKIRKVNLEKFIGSKDVDSYDWILNYSDRIASCKNSNATGEHHIKIVVDQYSVSVWDNGEQLLFNVGKNANKEAVVKLPQSDIGTGFGPIASYVEHYCSQISSFTFRNIVMETVEGQSLEEAVNDYNWRTGSERFLVNLSDEELSELGSNNKIASVAKQILNKNLNFYALGNENNNSQYSKLFKACVMDDSVKDSSDISKFFTNFTTEIENKVLENRDNSINQYVIKGEEISYEGYYSDPEGDPILESLWHFVHDNEVYENNEGLIEENDTDISKPIKSFDKTGAYGVSLKVRDNPPTGIKNSFEDKKKWSDVSINKKVIMVHRRPIVDLNIDVTSKNGDKDNCYVNMQENIYDLDHESRDDKGIVSKEYYWKNVNDDKWTEGRVPTKLPANENYLVMVKAKDMEGAYSEPSVQVVSTENIIENEPILDTEKPSVKLELSKYVANVGDKINVMTSATDNVGIDTVEIYIDNKLATNSLGSISFMANEGKKIPVKVVVRDWAGNETVVEAECDVTDNRDYVCPTVSIESPGEGASIYGDVQVTGTVTDNELIKNYKLMYKYHDDGDYILISEGNESKENDVLGKFEASKLKKGLYELKLEAEDYAGNKSEFIRTIRFNKVDESEEFDNESPTINLTLSDNKATIGKMITGKLDVTDNKEVESIELKINGETIITGNGGFQFTEQSPKIDEIEVIAVDTTGNKTIKKVYCQFVDDRDKTEPIVFISSPVSGSKITKKVDIIGYIDDETKLEKYKIEYRKKGNNEFKLLKEDINVKKNETIGTIDPNKLGNGIYEFKVTAIDAGGNSTFSICEYEIDTNTDKDSNKDDYNKNDTSIALVVSNSVAEVNQPIDLYIKANNYKNIKEIKAYADDKELAIKSGIATFVPDEAKIVQIRVIAKLTDGQELVVEGKCRIVNNVDKVAPQVDIVSPEEDSTINSLVYINGEISDESELESYKVEYKSLGSSEYILLKEENLLNTSNKSISVPFDATMMKNGLYECRVTAVDKGGNISIATSNYLVDGKMKIGNVSMEFEDIKQRAYGINMSVIRGYDSRNKENGDFGIGWDMRYKNISIESNGKLSEGWRQEEIGVLLNRRYEIQETKPHIIYVNADNGKTYQFKVALNPVTQAYVPISNVDVNFKCINNPDVKLEVAGDKSVLYCDAMDEGMLCEFNLNNEFNPKNFIFTDENGTEFTINKDNGLSKIKTNTGEEVTISENGVESSSGYNVTFERDNKNRITSIKDSYNNAVSYNYNEKGELESFINLKGKEVRYEYNDKHDLISLRDENGREVARNEYYEDGRIKDIYDALGHKTSYKYDLEGKKESVTDRRGYTTVYQYDDNGNITSIIDPLLNRTDYSYDDNNNLISKSNNDRIEKVYEYDDNNRLVSVKNANNEKVEATYNIIGKVSTIKDVENNIVNYLYDEKGRIESVKDENEKGLDFTYDSNGRLAGFSDIIGRKVQYTYDKNGEIETILDADNNITKISRDLNNREKVITKTRTSNVGIVTEKQIVDYDEFGNISKRIDGEGNVELAEYDCFGNILSFTDKCGKTRTFDYDDNSQLIKINYSDGTTEKFEYDFEGNNTKVITRDGITKEFKYDANGRVVSIQIGKNNPEEYFYDSYGNIEKVKMTNGEIIQYGYDNLGRNIVIKDKNNVIREYTYNSFSQIDTISDAYKNKYKLSYDSYGNCKEITNPYGNSVKFQYDLAGRLKVETDEEGKSTYYTYDSSDNVKSVENPLKEKWEYAYDEVGNLLEVKDPKGNITKYEYDNNGRVTKEIDSLNNTKKYEYYEDDRIKNVTDFNGNKICYEYDDKNNEEIKTLSNGDKVKYSYTPQGRLKNIEDKNGKMTYLYNEDGTVKEKVDYNGEKISYIYYASGDLKDVITPYSKTSYEYDYKNRLSAVTDENGNKTTYDYDLNSNLDKIIYPNGTTVKYSYNKLDKLTNKTITDKNGKVIDKYKVEFSDSGKVSKIEEGNGTATTYTYDDANRLVNETIIGKNVNAMFISYTYDANGNRISKTINGKTTEYEYDSNNRMTKDGEYTVEYDNNGNLKKRSNGKDYSIYNYDLENRLEAVEINKDQTIFKETYCYDGEGNKISSTSNKSIMVQYLVDTLGLSQVLVENDKTNNIQTKYTYGDELISSNNNVDGYRYYLSDSLNDIRMLTDNDGKVTDKYSYDSFGNLLSKEGNSLNSYLYKGQEYNINTDLYNLRARYFDTKTGRFISRDSYEGELANPDSIHKYKYANNNPISNWDPTGNNFTMMDLEVAMKIMFILAGVSIVSNSVISSMKHNINLLKSSSLAYNPLESVVPSGFTSSVSDGYFSGIGDFFDGLMDRLHQARKKSKENTRGYLGNTEYDEDGNIVGDDYEEPTSEKVGKPQNGKAGSNKVQNKQVEEVVKEKGLTKDQQRELHYGLRKDEPGGFSKVKDVAGDLFGD